LRRNCPITGGHISAADWLKSLIRLRLVAAAAAAVYAVFDVALCVSDVTLCWQLAPKIEQRDKFSVHSRPTMMTTRSPLQC